jgi:FtsP/CotA-like multicopper oxidase with cupredoxin domain
VDVPPDGRLDLRVQRVAKRIGAGTFAMLAYNGSIPGPTLRVRQGSAVHVDITNETEMDTTIHWHGVRLENQYDGVPEETQEPIPPGGRYTHRLTFPDAGLYWYHPHIREDIAQELGLYGNVLVEPADPDYWSPADRDIVLTLDDILIEDGQIAPFDPSGPDHAAMGRFGNVLLIGGETEQHLDVRRGEVLRWFLTNTANTRVFKVSLPGARMKLVGGDAGRHEREEWVDHAIVAPSERVVLDALLEERGTFLLKHETPGRRYPLVTISVVDPPVEPSRRDAFERLRVAPEMLDERARLAPFLRSSPDRTLVLLAEMGGASGGEGHGRHAGHGSSSGHGGAGHGSSSGHGGAGHAGGMGHGGAGHGGAPSATDGIEWEDAMPEANRATTAATMRWKIVDADTGRANGAIDWTFAVGDLVKIRVVNELRSDHPMHHPFHVHGQRFLVLARDGAAEANLVWKDTVLVRAGQTVDLLMEASNPGRWMAHCHIPEHMDTGMMFSFDVTRAGRGAGAGDDGGRTPGAAIG